jgi:hypothetical protein
MYEMMTVVTFKTLTVATPQGQLAGKTNRESEYTDNPEGMTLDVLYGRFMATCRQLNMAEPMDCHLLSARIWFNGILHK